MSIGFLFWLLMILWLVLGCWLVWRPGPSGPAYPVLGGNLLLFILLALLGLKAFGFPVHG